MAISQSTQIVIEKLLIHDKEETLKLDIKGLFEEINVFDSILFPCMSGNIVLRDAVGLSTKLNFDGNQYITLEMSKDTEYDYAFERFNQRRFVIWKQTDRKEINQSSEMYTLHFVSEEFLLSAQKKIRQSYKGTYSQIVQKILSDHLRLKNGTPDIGHIEPSKGVHDVVIPNKTPFDAINFLCKKAVNERGLSDYVFFQTRYGYNFISLSSLTRYSDTIANITFGVKNISGMYVGEEMYGARDVKVLSQYDLMESISQGVHAGKFIGFDTLTGQVEVQEIGFEKDVYNLEKQRANPNPLTNQVYNKENKSSFEMYDSKISVYPFQKNRTTNSHLRSKDSTTANFIDDTHNYIYQRTALFNNIMQKRLRIVVPGNFGLYAGYSVYLEYPNRFNDKTDVNPNDKTLGGRYMIVSARHIIRFDKHETILEVATDSTLRGEGYTNG
jgi:hypothetical protein